MFRAATAAEDRLLNPSPVALNGDNFRSQLNYIEHDGGDKINIPVKLFIPARINDTYYEKFYLPYIIYPQMIRDEDKQNCCPEKFQKELALRSHVIYRETDL